MSNYVKTTNFTAKDALSTGDPNKIIKGSGLDTEFDNIATASATKANKVISGTTNGIIVQTAGGDLANGTLTLPTGAVVGTSDTQTLTNKTINTSVIDSDNNTITNIVDADIKAAAAIDASKIGGGNVSTTEFNYLSGVTSDIQDQFIGQMTGSNNLSELTSESTARDNIGLAKNQSAYYFLGDESDGALNYTTTTDIASDELYCSSFNIDVGETLGVSESSNGFLIIRCTGTATIAGTIDLDGKGSAGGASVVGQNINGRSGTGGLLGGAGGGGVGGSTPKDGGIGGSSYNGTSGDGGAGSADSTVDATNATALTAQIESFMERHAGSLYAERLTAGNIGGSGGGSGGVGTTSTTSGRGGNGGGAVIIIADQIDFTGIITCDGEIGSNSPHITAGSGGGGGGGFVLLVARNFIADTGTITVIGAAGGAYSTYDGGAGADGHSASITLS